MCTLENNLIYSGEKQLGSINSQSDHEQQLYSLNHAIELDHERSLASSAIFCDGCTARSNYLAGSPWEARDARELLILIRGVDLTGAPMSLVTQVTR